MINVHKPTIAEVSAKQTQHQHHINSLLIILAAAGRLIDHKQLHCVAFDDALAQLVFYWNFFEVDFHAS